MTVEIHSAPQEIAPLLGDPHPLLEQLGAPDDLGPPALELATLPRQGIQSLPGLKEFLYSYRTDLLIPLELPAIVRSYGHAVRGELRELIALDRQMAEEPKLRTFAAASCRAGQRQLNRLRPLRDHRLVRRYREAVERGEAHGWHTLVFGVSLGVFSLALRQGLMAYAHHTLGGFIESAARPLALTMEQSGALRADLCHELPAAVQALLVPTGVIPLRVC